jgi:hypothetical protein
VNAETGARAGPARSWHSRRHRQSDAPGDDRAVVQMSVASCCKRPLVNGLQGYRGRPWRNFCRIIGHGAPRRSLDRFERDHEAFRCDVLTIRFPIRTKTRNLRCFCRYSLSRKRDCMRERVNTSRAFGEPECCRRHELAETKLRDRSNLVIRRGDGLLKAAISEPHLHSARGNQS